MAGRGQQQAGAMGPQNGPPQQTIQDNGAQGYNQPYGQPYGQYQPGNQSPMWNYKSAAPQQQYGNMGYMQNLQQPMMQHSQQPSGLPWLPDSGLNTSSSGQGTVNQGRPPTPPAEATKTPAAATPAAMQNSNITNPLTAAQNQANPQNPAKTNSVTNPLTAAQNQVNPQQPTKTNNITGPLTTAQNTVGVNPPPEATQNQAQTPAPPAQPTYTPPAPTPYTPPQNQVTPRDPRNTGYNPAVNGVVARPDGTPNYMIDHNANSQTNNGNSITGLLGGMQNEHGGNLATTNPNGPMNQNQQNLVNLGLNPLLARLYGG